MIVLPQALWLPPEKPAIIRPADKASFFPGQFPAAAAAAERLRTLSLFASAISTTHEVIGPAGVQAGDLIIIFKSGFGLGAPATMTPTGLHEHFQRHQFLWAIYGLAKNCGRRRSRHHAHAR